MASRLRLGTQTEGKGFAEKSADLRCVAFTSLIHSSCCCAFPLRTVCLPSASDSGPLSHKLCMQVLAKGWLPGLREVVN